MVIKYDQSTTFRVLGSHSTKYVMPNLSGGKMRLGVIRDLKICPRASRILLNVR